MAKLSISKAAKEWGISRKSIQDAVKSGDLHTESGSRNSKNVDTVDLLRIFGEPRTGHKTGQSIGEDVLESRSKQVNNSMTDKLIMHLEEQSKRLESEILFLREMVEKQNVQIQVLQKELSGARKPTRLLPWLRG
jgi:predicted RNase H-like nuclease (RuvC/YqgF family)